MTVAAVTDRILGPSRRGLRVRDCRRGSLRLAVHRGTGRRRIMIVIMIVPVVRDSASTAAAAGPPRRDGAEPVTRLS